MSRSRKSVRARVRADLTNFQMDLDPRTTVSKYEDTQNRYNRLLDMKKKEKRLRTQRKRAILHLGHKNLKNRWESLSDADYYN